MIAFEDIAEEDLIDTSYTASYDCGDEVWVSFHDWKPRGLFATRTELYSWSGEALYLHHSSELVCNFYDIQYDSYISPVFVTPYEDTNKKYPFKMNALTVDGNKPDSIWAFNSNQATREIDTVDAALFSSILEKYEKANIVFTKSRWNYNSYRNSIVNVDFIQNQFDRLAWKATSFGNPIVNDFIIDTYIVNKLTYRGNRQSHFNQIGYDITTIML